MSPHHNMVVHINEAVLLPDEQDTLVVLKHCKTLGTGCTGEIRKRFITRLKEHGKLIDITINDKIHEECE